jgi:hypothetical protein
VKQLQPSFLDFTNFAEHVVQGILIDGLRDATNENLPSLQP